ncbi:MAG: GIN domain-containing protein [Flavobacterium sp.]
MKKIVLLSFLFFSAFTVAQTKEKVKGSKIVKAEQKKVGNFESIEVEDNLEIFLVKGNESAIEIEADDNLIEWVEYKLIGSNLRISTLKDLSGFKKLSVRVTYTDRFNMVISKDETSVTALADVVLDDITFKSFGRSKLYLNANTKNFILMANDKSKVELNLKSLKAAVDLSKNATIKALVSSSEMKLDLYQKSSAQIEGDVIDFKLRLDNSTVFEGKKLTVKNALIEAGGYSKSDVNVSNIVTINAGGNSEIELYGEPKVDLKSFKESAILKKKPFKL